MTWKYTTVSIDTVRLSCVITGCGGNDTTCSRRSTFARTLSRKGTRKFNPGDATVRNRPSRSTTADWACGTTINAFVTTMTTNSASTATTM